MRPEEVDDGPPVTMHEVVSDTHVAGSIRAARTVLDQTACWLTPWSRHALADPATAPGATSLPEAMLSSWHGCSARRSWVAMPSCSLWRR
jgi:hypothetical protein